MAYTEDHAYELIKSAFERGRLGHAFILSGAKDSMESLATRLINLINKEDVNAPAKRKLSAKPKKKVVEEIEEESGSGEVDLFGNPVDGGGDMFDLFGEVESAKPVEAEVVTNTESEPEMVEAKPHVDAKNLAELEGELVRIVRPFGKARFIKVDGIRELEKSMFQATDSTKWKVGVIMDADRMQASAANAFLKTLEEPPKGSLLILLTQSPERLLPTILSRCVNISLMSSHAERVKLEGEQELLTALIRVGKQGFNSVSKSLTIKSVFATVLNKRKLAISKAYDLEKKEEEKHYKNATDGEWLKGREKHFEAEIQADYLNERSQFMDLLILWLGDLVRLKSGVTDLDFQSQQDAMRDIAEKEELQSLLRRMEALEELRTNLETNVSEALALEVGFMKAFG